jgi:murein DD-endopeptidase MepM/ murein hydrolase activator NlpD
MRLAPLFLFLALSGILGNLEAARPIRKGAPAVHTVRRGETASKIARANGLSLDQLADLNPKVNLAKLSVGTPLRVKGGPAKPKLVQGVLDASAAENEPAQPVAIVPVPPIPAIPIKGPVVLVHLERLIPTNMEVRPSWKATRSVSPFTSEDLAPVFPPNSGLEYESRVAGELGFEPADPNNLDFLWPVETRSISSSWGPRMRTRTVRVVKADQQRRVRVRYQGSHKGVDLRAPMGTNVYAAQAGRVVLAERHKQYGNYVILDHGNGVQTVYAHHRANCVRSGDIVQRGQKIAEVGTTGRSTGPHLHFELRLQGQQQNPLAVLDDVAEIPTEIAALNEWIAPLRKGP